MNDRTRQQPIEEKTKENALQEKSTIIKTIQNTFSETVEVVDTPTTRTLQASGICHGGFYRLSSGELTHLSPIAYTNAALLCPLLQERRTGTFNILFAGLGAGNGPVSLLFTDQRITATVIEIDKPTIELSRNYFPYLKKYEKENRLAIVHDDFFSWVESHSLGPKYDMVFLDIFVNKYILSDLYPISVLKKLRTMGRSIWLNHIDIANDLNSCERITVFKEAGIDFKMMFITPLSNELQERADLRNYLFTTDQFEIPQDPFLKSQHDKLCRFVANGLPVSSPCHPFDSTTLRFDATVNIPCFKGQ